MLWPNETLIISKPTGSISMPQVTDEERKAVKGPGSTPRLGLSLKHNFSWTLAGNFAYAGCQSAILLVIAKLGTPKMVGQFALGLAVTAPIILFANLKLRTVQATDARGEYKPGHYLAVRLVTTCIALAVIAAIALNPRYRGVSGAIILVIGLAKAFETLSDILYGLFQQHERMDKIAISMMIKGGLSLLSLGTILLVTGDLLLACIGLAASWAVLFFLFDLRNGVALLSSGNGAGERMSPEYNWGLMLHLAWQALPLGTVGMIGSLNTNIPRYFLEYHDGLGTLGFYAAMANILMVGSTIVNALGQSASPRLAIYHASDNRSSFNKLVFWLLVLGAGLGALTVLIVAIGGRQILTVLYTPAYAANAHVFLWLAAAAALRYAYVFLGTALCAMRRFHVQLPIHMVSLGGLALTCAFLVPRFGMMGAAIAMFGSAVIEGLAYGGVLLSYTLADRRKIVIAK